MQEGSLPEAQGRVLECSVCLSEGHTRLEGISRVSCPLLAGSVLDCCNLLLFDGYRGATGVPEAVGAEEVPIIVFAGCR